MKPTLALVKITNLSTNTTHFIHTGSDSPAEAEYFARLTFQDPTLWGVEYEEPVTPGNSPPKALKRMNEEKVRASFGELETRTGKIELYTILRLVSMMNGESGNVIVFKDSSLLSCLAEADPTHKHWHRVDLKHDCVQVWRRKEWNDSLAKQKLDFEKKEVALITQAEYAEAKAVVMEFLMLMCDNDKRAAEKMFYAQGLANDQQLLIKKAAKLSGMKERQEKQAEESKPSPELLTKIQALRLKLQGGKKQ